MSRAAEPNLLLARPPAAVTTSSLSRLPHRRHANFCFHWDSCCYNSVFVWLDVTEDVRIGNGLDLTSCFLMDLMEPLFQIISCLCLSSGPGLLDLRSLLVLDCLGVLPLPLFFELCSDVVPAVSDCLQDQLLLFPLVNKMLWIAWFNGLIKKTLLMSWWTSWSSEQSISWFW